MLVIEKVTIENYKSIQKAEYDVIPGVFKTTAEVVDGEYKSNGGGKSTALQAVFLGLYGVDFQGAPIDSVSNRFTGKPFKITIHFSVTYDNSSDTYVVINDRGSKKHFLYKNEKLVSQTYKDTAVNIKNIFGMSAQTFKFTHYITTSTILELTATLTNATLFNEILQVTQLKKIQGQVRELRKSLTADMNKLQVSLEVANQQQKLHDLLQGSSIEDVEATLTSLHRQIEDITESVNIQLLPLQEALKDTQENVATAKQNLKSKQDVLSTGICPTCNTVLVDEGLITQTKGDINLLQKDIEQLRGLIDETQQRIETLNDDLFSKKLPLEAQRQQLASKRDTYYELRRILDSTIDVSESNNLKQQYESLRQTITFFDNIDAAIKSGEVFESIMKDFFQIVNINIQKYRRLINFAQFEVEALPERSGMRVLIAQDGTAVPIESLSNGEKARLSLLILSALLEAMHEVSGTHTNFIVFDEATSSFDASGLQDLKNLFAHLVSIGQSCFIISHGTELHSVEFTGELKITKRNSVSTGCLIPYAD